MNSSIGIIIVFSDTLAVLVLENPSYGIINISVCFVTDAFPSASNPSLHSCSSNCLFLQPVNLICFLVAIFLESISLSYTKSVPLIESFINDDTNSDKVYSLNINFQV